MENYFYVNLKNKVAGPDEYGLFRELSTMKNLRKVISINELGYGSPRAIFIKDVKTNTYEDIDVKSNMYNEKEIDSYRSIPLICEMDVNEFYTEVITGLRFRASTQDSGNKYSDYVGPEIVLRIVKTINPLVVKKLLSSLSKEDIDRYILQVNQLHTLMKEGYEEYLEQERLKKLRLRSAEDYILKFKRENR